MKYIVMEVALGDTPHSTVEVAPSEQAVVQEVVLPVAPETSTKSSTLAAVPEPVEEETPDLMYQEIPILFPNQLNHIDVFTALKTIPNLANARAISAGFFNSGESRIACYGDSETLNLTSRGSTDDQLIRTHDYFHGLVD